MRPESEPLLRVMAEAPTQRRDYYVDTIAAVALKQKSDFNLVNMAQMASRGGIHETGSSNCMGTCF